MFLRDAFHRQGATIQRDLLGTLDVIAERGRFAVDVESAFPDPGLNLAAGPVTRGRKDFLDAFSQPDQATC